MNGAEQHLGLLIVLIGGLVVASILTRAVLDRTLVPPLVGFMALGFALRLADDRWTLLDEQGGYALQVLAQLGVIALLFRVGLESDLRGLVKQLPRASLVWVGNIVVSALPGYFVMTWLGFGPIPSLIAATALTATSIGVSVGMWREHDVLQTREGELLTDVAEMDDLSGVFLMALLFAILPLIYQGGGGDGGSALGGQLSSVAGAFVIKLLAFSAACFAFARYAEERLTQAFQRHQDDSELMVFVAGIGILIAGAAAALGFSAAIGALFAGFAFSRDPEAVRIDAGFHGLYLLFAPFFFIGIGLSLDPAALGAALATGGALATVAIAGKVAGAGLPALAATGAAGATLIGVSMVPRAEITMIIIEHGRQLGDWAVPPELYAAFVLVSALTCTIAPVLLSVLFRRWGPELEADEES